MKHSPSLSLLLLLFLSLSLSSLSHAESTTARVIVSLPISPTPYINFYETFFYARIAHAFEYAAQLINNDTSILPNTTLSISILDNQGAPGTVVKGILDEVERVESDTNDTVVALAVGPYNRHITPAVPLASSLGIVSTVVSIADTELEDRVKFPHLYRTLPSFSSISSAYLSLFRQNKWTQAVIVNANDVGFYSDLQGTQFESEVSLFPFTAPSSHLLDSSYDALFDHLERLNLPIVILSIGPSTATHILQGLFLRGTYDRFQFIGSPDMLIPGSEFVTDSFGYDRSLWKGLIGFRIFDDIYTDPSLSLFASQYASWMSSSGYLTPYINFDYVPVSPFEGYASDSILSLGRALHSLLSSNDISGLEAVNSTNLYPHFLSVNFSGSTGQVSFNEKREREEARFSLCSFNTGAGMFFSVGSWSSVSGLSLSPSSLSYRGGVTTSPADASLPLSVSSISLLSSNSSSIDVSWTVPSLENGRNATYFVELSLSLSPSQGNATWISLSSASLSLSDQGQLITTSLSPLPKETDYNVRVRITTHAGESLSPSTPVSTTPETTIDELSLSLSLSLSIIAGLGVLFSLSLGALVFKWRKQPAIRASTTSLLYLVSFGLSLGFATVPVLLQPSNRCRLTPLLLNFTFVFTFVPLFAKTWRIDRIFLSSSLTAKAIKNNTLFFIIGAYGALELLILVVWYAIDPPSPTLSPSSSSPYELERSCATDTPQVRWAMQLTPKFIVLFYGCVLAYQTRDVVASFNESKYLGFSLYNTFLMLSLSLALFSLIKEENMKLVVTAFGLFVILFAVAGSMFVPKFLLVLSGVEEQVFTTEFGTDMQKISGEASIRYAPKSAGK